MAALFWSFGAKSFSGGRKLVCNIYGSLNSLQAEKLFFLNYTMSAIYIF
jgi:hypothetical protein